MAPDRKNAKKPKAWLGFLDESGFSQRPPIRATGAPRGQTPELVEPFNWQTLSGIGAVLSKPGGERPRWLLALHRGSIRSAQLIRFLAALKRYRRRPVILLWDRLPAHRSRLTRAALEGQRSWLTVEWLPAYAPELNPVEQLWAHLDATALPITPIEDLPRLQRRVGRGLQHVQRRPQVGRGFLRHTSLF